MTDHDDLGARLRTALQEISSLATDPVPPPRFLAVDTADGGDVIDLGDAGGPPRRPRPRRRFAVAGAVLLAAAVAAGVAVAVADVARTSAVPAATTSPSPTSTAVDPNGIALDGAIWRCTAPAGTFLGYSGVLARSLVETFTVGAGVRCGPIAPADAAIVVHPDGHVGVVSPEPASWSASSTCTSAESQQATSIDGSPQQPVVLQPASGAPAVVGGGGLSGFVSRGDRDYLEFYGSGCRLVIAPSAVDADPGVPTPTIVAPMGSNPWAGTDFSRAGPALGGTTLRCTAPAGRTLRAALFGYHGGAESDWFVSAGATCRPISADAGARSPAPDTTEGYGLCTVEQSRVSEFPPDTRTIPSAGPHGAPDHVTYPMFDSRGDRDFLDFAGDACRVSFPGS